MNNAGGAIFKVLEGAKDLPELDEFMVTQQPFTAENTAKDAGFSYLKASNWIELESCLAQFLGTSSKGIILEILTNSTENTLALQNYMALFKH